MSKYSDKVERRRLAALNEQQTEAEKPKPAQIIVPKEQEMEMKIINQRKEIQYWQERCKNAEEKAHKLESKLAFLNDIHERTKQTVVAQPAHLARMHANFENKPVTAGIDKGGEA